MTGWTFTLHFIDTNSSHSPAVPCNCRKWVYCVHLQTHAKDSVWDVTQFSV